MPKQEGIHNVGTAISKVLSPTEYPRGCGAPLYASALVLAIARTPNSRFDLVTRSTETPGAYLRRFKDNPNSDTDSLSAFY